MSRSMQPTMAPTADAPASLLITFASDSRDDLLDAPIRPEHVLSGAPRARALTLADLGHGLSVWMWDCTAGSFHWDFGGCDEVVHIVEGGVTVVDQDGGVVRLGAGDVATFRAHTTATWHVDDYVKKVAVNRGLPTDPLSRFARAVRMLGKRLLRR